MNTHQIGKAYTTGRGARIVILCTIMKGNYSSAAKETPHPIGRIRIVVPVAPRSSRRIVPNEDEPQRPLRITIFFLKASTAAAAAAALSGC